MLTDEFRLRLAIGLRDIPALATRPAGISGIDQEDGDPCQLCLVADKSQKLIKSPLSKSLPLAFFNRDPEPFKVLKGNSPSGVLRQPDNPFSNGVIGVALKSAFSARQLFKVPLGRFCSFLLEGFSKGIDFNANLVNLLTRKGLAVRSGNKVANSEVKAKYPLRVNRLTIRDFYTKTKIKMSLLINQVGLASNSALFKFGVRAKDNRNSKSAVKAENRN